MISRKRILIVVWLISFVWWCAYGASWFLAKRGYDEPSTWVGALSLPWLGIGLIAGGVALMKPTRWTIGAFGLVSLAQMTLVLITW
jgi:hypothetical protein